MQLETVAGAQVMRKRKPRKTEFSINELPEEIQQKVLDRYRYWNVEDFEWWDGLYEIFQEDAEAKGFEIGTKTEKTVGGKTFQKPAIYFSGFCSQGDGASFEATVDIEKYIKAYAESLIKAGIDIFALRKIVKNDPCKTDWELETPSITQDGRYCHEMTMDISFSWNGDPQEEIRKALEQMGNFILEDAQELAKGLYKKLADEYDYQTEDERIKEALECNEKKFTGDGEDV